MSYKVLTERTGINVSKEDLLLMTQSRAWVAFCQSVRVKQQLMHDAIKSQPTLELKALLHEKIDILDEMIAVPKELWKHNCRADSHESIAREIEVRKQLKGDMLYDNGNSGG